MACGICSTFMPTTRRAEFRFQNPGRRYLCNRVLFSGGGQRAGAYSGAVERSAYTGAFG